MRPWRRPTLLPAFALLTACTKTAPAEPITDAAPAVAPQASADAHSQPLRERPMLIPSRRARGPLALPREPDWSLDPRDPARDYVDRYIHGTARYGEQTACVVVGSSTPASGASTVKVTNAPNGSCGAPDQVRDSFRVDVPADRLSLVDPATQDRLAKWPDGSDPEGPPGTPLDNADMRPWKTPLRGMLTAKKLAPIRVQGYGRGTYPVITVAGWHEPLVPDAPPGTLNDLGHELCTANENRPFAIFAGFDRSRLLRFDCPDRVRWDAL